MTLFDDSYGYAMTLFQDIFSGLATPMQCLSGYSFFDVFLALLAFSITARFISRIVDIRYVSQARSIVTKTNKATQQQIQEQQRKK